MPIKLIAIDMDGTLLNENSQLNPRTIDTIQKASAQGIKVVLATGRPLLGVTRFLKQLDLLTPDNYVLSYNGSLVQETASGKVIVAHELDYQDYLEITYMARKVGVHVHAEDAKYIYTPNRDISPYTVWESSLVQMPLRYRSVDEMPRDSRFSKLMMIDEPKILAAGAAQLPEAFKAKYNLVKSEAYYLEVLNKNASKGNGLADLARFLNIPVTETMAIGDQANDLSMLQYAGLAVAMGNAISEVKKASDVITANNREDGVAQAIEKYALNTPEVDGGNN